MKKTLTLFSAIISLQANAQLCFDPKVDYTAGTSPYQVISKDFNNDGIPDLASIDPSVNVLSVSLGTGGGSIRTFFNNLSLFTILFACER
jgi:hypothetical protein